MKILIYSICVVAIFLVACNEGTSTTIPELQLDEAVVTVNLELPDSESVELSSLTNTQEKRVNDINIYSFHQATGKCTRKYVTGKTSTMLTLLQGRNSIYVVVNQGYDLGDLSIEEVQSLQFLVHNSEEFDYDLPMSGFIETTINAGSNFIFIPIKKIVARVDATINIPESLSTYIQLKTISLISVPFEGYFFKENDTSKYINFPEANISNGQTVSFYMLENRQGVNSAITDERHKGKANAPAHASYLHIKAATSDSLLDYYIYLGENTLNDFNVIANKKYSLTINIQGTSQADWRVTVTPLKKNININIANLTRSTLIYYPDLKHVGSDVTLNIAVTLSSPSEYPITLWIGGSYVAPGTGIRYYTLPEKFFWDNYITIPAGSMSATKQLYRELRLGRDNLIEDLFFSQCYISQIDKNTSDKNTYSYMSGYYPVTDNQPQYSSKYPTK